MEDEVHFQLYGSTCHMWIPPEEKDPVVRHHPTRESTGYFGAVRVRDGKFVWQREDASFNGETFFHFLRLLRRVSRRSGRRTVVVLDNVRYHHAKLHQPWRRSHAGRFELLFLPAYSPEYNTIERVWKITRRTATHNRYFASLDDVAQSVETAFRSWTRPNATLRRLCACT
jgi:transposase